MIPAGLFSDNERRALSDKNSDKSIWSGASIERRRKSVSLPVAAWGWTLPRSAGFSGRVHQEQRMSGRAPQHGMDPCSIRPSRLWPDRRSGRSR